MSVLLQKIKFPDFLTKKNKKFSHTKPYNPYLTAFLIHIEYHEEGQESMIKLKNNSNESRTMKQTREQAKSMLDQDLDLKPAIKLSKQGKQFFDLLLTLVGDSDVPFAQIDSLQLSLLAESLDQLQQSLDSIHSDGVMIDGKRNMATTVYNSTLKNVDDLLRDLNLTMNARVKQLLNNVQSGDVDDPFAELMSDDWLCIAVLQ